MGPVGALPASLGSIRCELCLSRPSDVEMGPGGGGETCPLVSPTCSTTQSVRAAETLGVRMDGVFARGPYSLDTSDLTDGSGWVLNWRGDRRGGENPPPA